MRSPIPRLLLALAALASILLAQDVTAPRNDPDGVLRVPSASLHRLESSPKIEFPRELGAYEIQDEVTADLTISADGKVERAKVAAKYPEFKSAVEKAVKQWQFAPYTVNEVPTRVRAEFSFHFNNGLDSYRDELGRPAVKLSQVESHAYIVKSVPPRYPPDARAGRIQGQVFLHAIVGRDGHVQRLRIVRGHPMLAAAAFNAAIQWVYRPYQQNGETMAVDTEITINFTLA